MMKMIFQAALIPPVLLGWQQAAPHEQSSEGDSLCYQWFLLMIMRCAVFTSPDFFSFFFLVPVIWVPLKKGTSSSTISSFFQHFQIAESFCL